MTLPLDWPGAAWLAAGLAALAVLLLLLVLYRQARHGAAGMEALLREHYRQLRDESGRDNWELREEIAGATNSGSQMILTGVAELGRSQRDVLAALETRVQHLVDRVDSGREAARADQERRLERFEQAVEGRLDKMRELVEERLQSTLDRRLGESFRQVSERLEAVQKGLGEMQSLASGVGELKRVLTNVKARGTWGEVQLGALLEEVLTPDQFARNVRPRPDTGNVVEFAIRLPGERGDPVWLPIDAKFPQEDYQRLQDAADAGDAEAAAAASTALVRSVRNSARQIADKYLDPPHTTDFAILFLPTEGLFSEVLRQPGLVDALQRDSRVVVAGPTTLAAVLSSLRMGFRTLAIEQRSSEVWRLLAGVRSEFERFGEQLARVRRQLDAAARAVDETGSRTRQMARRLDGIEKLPADAVNELFDGAPAVEGDDAP